MTTTTAIDHAELQRHLRGTEGHTPTFDAHWTSDRTGTVVYLPDSSLIEVSADGVVFHVHNGTTDVLQSRTASTDEAYRIVRGFAKQYTVKVQAERLLKVLEEDVPSGVAHYAVEGAKKALRTLVREAHTINYFYGS